MSLVHRALRSTALLARPLAGGRAGTRTLGVATRARKAALFHTAPALRQNNKKHEGEQEEAAAGSYARTDDTITVEYPGEGELPSSKPVAGAGRAGAHVFPTLAAFSLQGKVGVVTGGARGLGLVMGQGMVVSGADLAIVDLNSTEHGASFERLRPGDGSLTARRGGSRQASQVHRRDLQEGESIRRQVESSQECV
jgi:hypothetical protein